MTASPWLARIADDPVVVELARRLAAGGAHAARGAAGSSTTMLAAALAARLDAPLLLVVAHLDEADDAAEEIAAQGVDVVRLPAMEALPGETNPDPRLVADRLEALRRVESDAPPRVVVAPFPALMQPVPDRSMLERMQRRIRPGDRIDPRGFAAWLDDAGYRRVEMIETAGEFALRGDILDLFPAGGEPVRIDLFGEEVESLHVIDLDSMGSDRRIDQVVVIGAQADALIARTATRSFLDAMPATTVAMLAELLELVEQGRAYFDRVSGATGIAGPPEVFRAVRGRCAAVLEVNHYAEGSSGAAPIELPVGAAPTFDESVAKAIRELAESAETARTVLLAGNAGERQRAGELLAEQGTAARVAVEERYLHRGFVWRPDEAEALLLVPYHELVHRWHARRGTARLGPDRATDLFVELAPGDHVVHRDHGIAIFRGLALLEDRPDAEEYLVLEFARRAKLNVPASKIELVQKYVGGFSGTPELSSFGGRRWKRQKENVAEAVRDLAGEMLRLQAARAATPGIRYPDDTPWQREFEAEFPYEETDDQVAAIAAVKSDMRAPRPMDRLVCGDVGFGKTEVAIRAAFKAVEHGKQVAVLVPTTILAEQHERTFRERFAGYPFRVEALSRFRDAASTREVLAGLVSGAVDVVVGTHRILSEDVRFADLGLVVVDEEQRFGVEHKQRLLRFRATVDVLTLTATPIPRTLHMAMLGLRDISALATAPHDRRAIVTDVIPWNPQRVQQAIRRELAREGQVFFVHNRVHDIESVADEVRRLAPDAKVVVGHGQMAPKDLERVVLSFIRGRADVLVSTTIIESGIDIPRANTMIIHDATIFGLSELHQLRGRVGRYKHRAYCYLCLPADRTATEKAMKRLRALESLSMLGAGFRIALRDLEIRGAGNLLGAEQSGHIAAVGYDMYCRLLEAAVEDLREGRSPKPEDATIDLGLTGTIPKGWIPSDGRRMDAYRRIGRASDYAALDRIRHDLESAYGRLPQRTERLLALAEIRISSVHLEVRSIVRSEGDVVFRTRDPRRLEQHLDRAKGTKRVVGEVDARGCATIYYRPPANYFEGDSILTVLRERLRTKEARGAAPREAEATA